MLLPIEDTPAFEENVGVLAKESEWIRLQSHALSASLRAYADSIDPRLRRPPAIGLSGGLQSFTAPLLEALGRPDQHFGSPWDNAEKRLADMLESLMNPEGFDNEEDAWVRIPPRPLTMS
eukprot:1182638-Prorocentrum_minimum.AAC.2